MIPRAVLLLSLASLGLGLGLAPGSAFADRPLPSWSRYQARTTLVLGGRALTRGDFETAALSSERACALTPADPAAWLLLARSQAARAEWKAAHTAITRAVSLAPRALDPALLEGHILVELQEREAAISSFSRAADLGSSSAGSELGLALVAARLDGDWAACADHLRAANRADPNTPLATLPLQAGWRQLSDNRQFIEALEWVLRETAVDTAP